MSKPTPQHIIQARRELFWETINYYRADPENRKATNTNDKCLYRTNDGRKCAIGRLCDDKTLEIYEKEMVGSIFSMTRSQYNLIPHKYRRLGKEFLKDLQSWHDDALGHGTLEAMYSREIWNEFCV